MSNVVGSAISPGAAANAPIDGGREAIHQPGAIQPTGFLLAFSGDWRVVRASANVAAYLGVGPERLIGSQVHDVLAWEAVHTLRNRLMVIDGDAVERVFGVTLTTAEPDRRFDCAVHRAGETVVVEAEPSGPADANGAATLIRAMMARLENAGDLAELSRLGARQLHGLTGYDRVMVLRVDPDGAGEVVADVARGGADSVLGRPFPASDPTRQARALHLRTSFRIIADIDAGMVPVVPAYDAAGAPIDLSLALLRFPSPAEIQDLREMGAVAAFSIPIVVDGRLWGVFACHHPAPRRPSFAERTAADLFGQMFALKLETRERQVEAPVAVMPLLADGTGGGDRHRGALHQEVLIAELNHRVRNILALIRGLVRQSRDPDMPLAAYVATLDGRIEALARAHDQISEDKWSAARLRTLFETGATVPASDGGQGLSIVGEEVMLEPTAFSTMALVVHELMTNSAKHGALGGGGRVMVDWTLAADGALAIDWRERGGPPVDPPTRRGFGTTIIERSIPYDLGGSVEVDYAPQGLEVRLTIPAVHVRRIGGAVVPDPSIAARATEVAGAPAAPLLVGRTILLVEDSLIIALDAEGLLTRLGAARVATAATVGSALEELARTAPEAAVLDINLGQEDSFPVADRLRAQGIPFIFATGYGNQARLPAAHAGVPILQKPYTLAGLAAALSGLGGAAAA